MKRYATALAFLSCLVAATASAQTATPTGTPTPTVTPTSTDTPTPTPTATNTPIGTKPFRADNLETKIETWIGLIPPPAVAPANDGRIYYDASGQDFMCSKNGGGYVVCGLVQPTATPMVIPTETPIIDLLYSGKLNLGADASGTPLGLVSITANATPAPHDRVIKCAPPNSTPVAYTMPPATGSGRVIDMINTTGSGPCSMDRAGGDLLNDQTQDTLINKWDADTCYDIAGAQWACRNLPTPTPTP